jgi:hypothetical protein
MTHETAHDVATRLAEDEPDLDDADPNVLPGSSNP